MHTSFLQLGRLHIPIFGVFAAIGVMAALTLSQRTGRYAGLAAEAAWNAGVTAVVSLFAISRLLLVVFNWHSFMQYPLQLLAVPSLTSLGVLLTGFFLLAYLRWGGIPLLPFLDAMAPCTALLWACFSAGQCADGTRDGMPMAGWLGHGTRVHPVELYTLFAALAICPLLLWWLKRSPRAGSASGIGCVFAGVAIYFIDFFRLPSDLVAGAWIDPAQAVGLMMVLAGAALTLSVTSMSSPTARREEIRTEDHHAV